MDLKKLEELIRIFEASSLSEIEIEEEGRKMRLRKPEPMHVSAALPYNPQSMDHGARSLRSEAVEQDEPEELEEQLPTIDSPMVGTFYSAPAPGEDPFVREGQRVEENQTVCIVEAMKLMNEVGAKYACIIEKTLVDNGEPVEFGQPLFAVRPV